MGNSLRNNRIVFRRQIAAVLLVLVMLLQMIPMRAKAVDFENLFALNVATGEASGDNVRYFGMHYLDEDGIRHVEYLFPHDGSLTQSFEIAAQYGFEEKKAEALGQLSVDFSLSSVRKPLSSYSMDTYFFTPVHKVASVLGVEVFCMDKGTWDVQNMQVYKVAQIHGLYAEGYHNSEFFVRFSGTAMGQMAANGQDMGHNFSWIENTAYRMMAQGSTDVAFDVSVAGQSYTTPQSQLVFTMSFADLFDAGLENLVQPYDQKRPISSMNFSESYMMAVEYLNGANVVCVADIPVLTSSLAWMIEQGLSPDSAISGLAQQGETIAFSFDAPGVRQILSVTLYSGSDAQQRLNVYTTAGGVLQKVSVAEQELARITNISVYDEMNVRMEPAEDASVAHAPRFTYQDSPLYYHTAADYHGEEVSLQNGHYMAMSDYETGAILDPANTVERYIIRLKADENEIFEIPDDVYLRLLYRDIFGAVQETGQISLKEAVADFYGYWPSSEENYAYERLMYSEEGVSVVVDLRNVDCFTGIRIGTSTATEDWQLQQISIGRVNSISPRNCYWLDETNADGYTNRRFERTVDSYELFKMEETILVQPGDEYTMDFVSNSVLEIPEVDWSDMEYAMSFEQSCANLGFTKPRETYTVDVQVSGSTVTDSGNGDSGSKNKFYFQLEFEEGNSAYVLANQQLGGDGFRSGFRETFTITTNQDYGELVAVNIIPDDISEGSDPYDKLNVERIVVSRGGTGQMNREWIIDNVGWIGIDYRDDGAATSISGQEGRTEAEMVRNFRVTYRSYTVNVLFCLSIGEYNLSNGTIFGGANKFDGTVEGILEYYNSKGEVVQQRFDLVKELYNYANKAYNAEEGGAVPDSYMFRANHTDRFILKLEDVSQLKRMTLYITSPTGGNLNIEDISASLITSDGTLQINTLDEYQRTNETEPLCTDIIDKSPSYSMFLPTGQEFMQHVDFTANEIKVDKTDLTYSSAISREPESTKDELNIYIYPSAKSRGEYDLQVAAQYTDVYGRMYQSSSGNMQRTTDSNGQEVYAILGLSATRMSTLNKLTIRANSLDVVDAYIDHAVVQRVRSGVVISTYYVPCEERNAEQAFTAVPNEYSTETDSQQTVTIQLGDGTLDANLIPEDRDVAVALTYTTKNDAGQKSYNSKYVFLTDFGYDSIQAGDLLTLTFEESYIQQITGLVIAPTGGITVDVDMASVGDYSVDQRDEGGQIQKTLLNSWTSFANGGLFENKSGTIRATEGISVLPLRLELKTAEAESDMDTGTNAKMGMRLSYVDAQGVSREVYYEDIRRYVTSEGRAFDTDSTTVVELLLRNAAELSWVEFIPHDEDPTTNASWKLESILLDLGVDGTKRILREPQRWFLENGETEGDENRVGLLDIILTLDTRLINEADQWQGTSHRGSSLSGRVSEQTADAGDVLAIQNISLSKSTQGVTIQAVRKSPGKEDVDITSRLICVDTEKNIWHCPITAEDSGASIEVTLSAKERPEVTVVIPVKVNGEVPPETQSISLEVTVERRTDSNEISVIDGPDGVDSNTGTTAALEAESGDYLVISGFNKDQMDISAVCLRDGQEVKLSANAFTINDLGHVDFKILEGYAGDTITIVISSKTQPDVKVTIVLTVAELPVQPEEPTVPETPTEPTASTEATEPTEPTETADTAGSTLFG